MMLMNKTPKHGWMRLLYIVPVVALSLVATAKTVVDYTIKSTPSTTLVKGNSIISYSPTLVNPAHPQPGGAYMIDVNEENLDKMPSKLREDLHLVNGRYKIALYKATTKLMLDGKEFDENSIPDLQYKDVLQVEGGDNANGQMTLNIITNPYKLSDADFRSWVHRQRMSGVSHGEMTQKLLNVGPVPRKHILMVNDEYRNAKYNGKKEVVEVAGEDPVFNIPEKVAEFPGGVEKMMKFISENIKYPKEASEQGLQGRIMVRFVVEKDGSLTNLEVMNWENFPSNSSTSSDIHIVTSPKDANIDDSAKSEVAASPSKLFEDEALRVVRLMPKWQPAKQKGQVVRSHFTIPLTFRLN